MPDGKFSKSLGLIQHFWTEPSENACKGEEQFMEGLRFLQYQLIQLVTAKGFS